MSRQWWDFLGWVEGASNALKNAPPAAGTSPTYTAPAPGSKVKERIAAQAERDAPYARQIARNQDQQTWDNTGYVAPIYRDTPESIAAASIQKPDFRNAVGNPSAPPDYRNAIGNPSAPLVAQPMQSKLDNLNTMTPSQTGSGKTAFQVIEEFLSSSTAENRKKLNELENQVRGMANPYDTSRPEFKAALAGAANRVASVMGQRSAQDIRQMAGAGMLGSAKAAAMKYNQEESARRAQASAQEGLYAQAMQGYNAFEQKRLSDLAALRGQAFRDEMQGIGAIGGATREAFTLPVNLESAQSQNTVAKVRAQEAEANLPIILATARNEFDKIGLKNEADRLQLEAAIRAGKLAISEGNIKVQDAQWWESLPGPLRNFLDSAAKFGKTFIQGVGEGVGKGAVAGAKGG